MSITLSKPSKMPCPSWSLPAWFTCPGARDKGGKPTEACSKCYALQGRYLFANVRAARERNQKDWQRSGWVDDMVSLIKDEPYFRWFDSGDIYSVKLAQKIIRVCEATPATQHWIPTRSGKIPKFAPYLESLSILPNVVVRHSSDKIDKVPSSSRRQSSVIINNIVIHPTTKLKKGVALCEAYSRKGKCGDCRSCWSKKIDIILYPIHGGEALPSLMRRSK